MARIDGSKIENCELHVKVESRTFLCFILKYSPAILSETKMDARDAAGGKKKKKSAKRVAGETILN